MQKRLTFIMLVLALAALACEASLPEGTQATAEAAVNQAVQVGLAEIERQTGLPMPDVGAISNISFENGQLNFQVEAKFETVLDYYRKAALAAAFTERELNTSITDTTASLIFDGHESGKALVLQIVDLGNGSVSVNLRLEDL